VAAKEAKARPKQVEPDGDEAENLRNDVALQNLLSGKTSLFEGSASKRSISVLEQQNVPMHIRKGVQKKATERESERRRQAKEAGVILERAVMKKQSIKRRERGVGGPSVGRFSGGMLKLNRKDIQEIQGKRRGKVVKKKR
jgi:hypothetical protein